jgi:hypothetical protein
MLDDCVQKAGACPTIDFAAARRSAWAPSRATWQESGQLREALVHARAASRTYR